MPNKKQNLELQSLLQMLRQLESISKELQRESSDLAIARACFDEAIEFCPSMKSRLSASAEIILHPQFESGLLKILDGNCEQMSVDEIDSVKCLRKPAAVVNTEQIYDNLNLAERARKRRKFSTSNKSADYI